MLCSSYRAVAHVDELYRASHSDDELALWLARVGEHDSILVVVFAD